MRIAYKYWFIILFILHCNFYCYSQQEELPKHKINTEFLNGKSWNALSVAFLYERIFENSIAVYGGTKYFYDKSSIFYNNDIGRFHRNISSRFGLCAGTKYHTNIGNKINQNMRLNFQYSYYDVGNYSQYLYSDMIYDISLSYGVSIKLIHGLYFDSNFGYQIGYRYNVNDKLYRISDWNNYPNSFNTWHNSPLFYTFGLSYLIRR